MGKCPLVRAGSPSEGGLFFKRKSRGGEAGRSVAIPPNSSSKNSAGEIPGGKDFKLGLKCRLVTVGPA